MGVSISSQTIKIQQHAKFVTRKTGNISTMITLYKKVHDYVDGALTSASKQQSRLSCFNIFPIKVIA